MIAKPLVHGSTPAAMAGWPDSDDTATAPVGAGALHGLKWSHEAKNGHAGCQKGRLDGCTESDPSQPDPAPAAVAGRQDREDENERISLDIFGYHLENWVRYLTRHLWRFCGDLYWRSLGYLKDIHGYLWISLLDLRLDIIWISKGDLCWISCGYVRFKRISFGYLLWKYD